MDKQPQFKFLMFQNETNICWLDASIALIVHCRTFKKSVESSSESQIKKIILAYNEAMEAHNSSVPEQKLKSPKMLEAIQSSTLNYLKQFLKCKEGEPDSAFCALLNLIYQDKSDIKECLNVSWIWKKQCLNCGKKSNSAISKPIITLSKVNIFHPTCPTSLYTCTCKSEQEMTAVYKELPPCLIFHFEKGAGTGTTFPSCFSIKGREYKLTAIIFLEKSSIIPELNHFVTMIRNPLSNEWLECNDLNPDSAVFTPVKPEYNFNDIYMVVFEAFDDIGILNTEISIEQDVENTNVELIELSEGENTGDEDSANDSEPSIKNDEASNFSKGPSSEISASNELLPNNVKDTALQSFKKCDNEKSEEIKTPCNSNSKIISLCNFKLPVKGSQDKHEILANSEAFDYQAKSVGEFFETKESKNETADPEHKVLENSRTGENFYNSSDTSKISTFEDFLTCSSEKVKKLSPKHKLEAESEKTTEKSFKTKKFKAKATDYPKHQITDTINADTTNEKLPMTIKHAFIGDTSDTQRKILDKYGKKKPQIQIKLKSFKKYISSKNNENEHTSSSEMEKNTNDNEESTSSGRIKESPGSKHLSPNKEKNIPMELSGITEHGTTRDPLDARKNEVDKHDGKKSSTQMRRKPLKKYFSTETNENKHASSNEVEKSMGNNEDTCSSERIKERLGDLSSNEEKNMSVELPLITKHETIRNNPDAGKREVGKYDGKKSQIQMSSKKNHENTQASSSGVRKRAEGNADARSNKRIKKGSSNKCVSPNNGKNALIINDQITSTSTVDEERTKSTSVVDEKLPKSTVKQSEGLPDSDNSRKENVLKMDPQIIRNTFAAFFRMTMDICRGKEENESGFSNIKR